MDDEPMWAADHVVAPTPGSAITIPKTANEFAIKGSSGAIGCAGPPEGPCCPCSAAPIPVEWSPIPVVTASMSKSAQATPVRYGQMSVMLQSLPASCGLPVASLKSQSDSYGQLPAAVRSLSADSSL
ncbi:hypothetical protein Tco_1360580 [Tanacetum coccineum]